MYNAELTTEKFSGGLGDDSVLFVMVGVFVAVSVVFLQCSVVNELLDFASSDDLQVVLHTGHNAQLSVVWFLGLDWLQQSDAYLVNHLTGLMAHWVDERDWLVFNVDGFSVVKLLESFWVGSFSWNYVTIGFRANGPDLDGHFLDVTVDSDLAQQTRKASFFGGEVDGDDWLVGGVNWKTLGGAVWTKVGWSSLAGWVDVDVLVWKFVWLAHNVNAADLWVFLVVWFIDVVGRMWIVGVWVLLVQWFIMVVVVFVWLVAFQAWSKLFWVLMVILYGMINILRTFWDEDVFQFNLDASVDLELEAVWRVGLDWSQNSDADLVGDDSGLLGRWRLVEYDHS